MTFLNECSTMKQPAITYENSSNETFLRSVRALQNTHVQPQVVRLTMEPVLPGPIQASYHGIGATRIRAAVAAIARHAAVNSDDLLSPLVVHER